MAHAGDYGSAFESHTCLWFCPVLPAPSWHHCKDLGHKLPHRILPSMPSSTVMDWTLSKPKWTFPLWSCLCLEFGQNNSKIINAKRESSNSLVEFPQRFSGNLSMAGQYLKRNLCSLLESISAFILKQFISFVIRLKPKQKHEFIPSLYKSIYECPLFSN